MKAVYQIRNLVNGIVYIGSTINFYQRARQHLALLIAGTHYNKYLQSDYTEFGGHNFVIEVVYPFAPNAKRSELYDIEQEFIDRAEYKYNIREDARDTREITVLGIIAHESLHKIIIRDIRYLTDIPGQFITTVEQADEIRRSGGIVIRVKNKFKDNKHIALGKYRADYDISEGNPDSLVYKFENCLAKYNVI